MAVKLLGVVAGAIGNVVLEATFMEKFTNPRAAVTFQPTRGPANPEPIFAVGWFEYEPLP